MNHSTSQTATYFFNSLLDGAIAVIDVTRNFGRVGTGGAPRASAFYSLTMPSYPQPMWTARALVDNVIATVNIQRFAGDQPRGIMREKCRGGSDVVYADKAARGGLCLCLIEQSVDSGIPDAALVARGPGEIAWTRIPFGPSSAAR